MEAANGLTGTASASNPAHSFLSDLGATVVLVVGEAATACGVESGVDAGLE